MNRKGQGLEMIPLMLVMLLVFGFGAYILYDVYSDIRPQMQDRLGDDADSVLDDTGSLVDGMGNIFVILLGGALLFVIVSGVVRESHPVMFVVSILVLVGLLAVGYAMSQAFEKLDSSAEFAGASAQFGTMSSLLQNLPLVVLVLIIIGGIVVYVRYKG